MSIHNVKNLVKQKSWFKIPENPSCIELILTNESSFQNGSVSETKLSGFYKLITAVLKQHFPKLKPKVVNLQGLSEIS